MLSNPAAASAENPSGPVLTILEPNRVGKIVNPALDELSGLAFSRSGQEVLWAVNDRGNKPLLHAIGTDGADLGAIRIKNGRNHDWEDVAAFKLGATAYLLVADIGDNHSRRKSCLLYVIKEPAVPAEGFKHRIIVNISAQIRFTYEDGPRDCEAVAVDSGNKKILIVSKRTLPPVLYELPLDMSRKKVTLTARRLTSLSNLVLPTAMDISPQNDMAVVLTYKHAYLYMRLADEGWANAFSRSPHLLKFKALEQQEAVCFSRDARALYLSSEGRYAPLIRLNMGTAPSIK